MYEKWYPEFIMPCSWPLFQVEYQLLQVKYQLPSQRKITIKKYQPTNVVHK